MPWEPAVHRHFTWQKEGSIDRVAELQTVAVTFRIMEFPAASLPLEASQQGRSRLEVSQARPGAYVRWSAGQRSSTPPCPSGRTPPPRGSTTGQRSRPRGGRKSTPTDAARRSFPSFPRMIGLEWIRERVKSAARQQQSTRSSSIGLACTVDFIRLLAYYLQYIHLLALQSLPPRD